MSIYWFLDVDGHYWQLVAATSEDRAWELFFQETSQNDSEMTMEKLKEDYKLGAVTEVSEREGQIASILPLECNFTIRDGFGSDKLGHRINL
jgi:hypothetical protein